MKLKKDLVLRKIAGEYIVVPIGRLSRVSPMMQITSSTAWLWEQMKETDFTEDSLVEAVLSHFSGVDEMTARKDVQGFLNLLDKNYMLDNGKKEPVMGTVEVQVKKEQLEQVEKKQK